MDPVQRADARYDRSPGVGPWRRQRRAERCPREFEIVTESKGAPKDSYWGVAKAVPHKDIKGKWIRLEIKPPRPVGEHTKLRFRHRATGASAMTVQVFDLTAKDKRHINMKDLKQDVWQWAILDFTKDGKRNPVKVGNDTPVPAGHKVNDLYFFIEPEGDKEVNLYIDEVALYDAGPIAER